MSVLRVKYEEKKKIFFFEICLKWRGTFEQYIPFSKEIFALRHSFPFFCHGIPRLRMYTA
jgi:hypothetical protein